jgi:hypothetical protein
MSVSPGRLQAGYQVEPAFIGAWTFPFRIEGECIYCMQYGRMVGVLSAPVKRRA